VSYYMGGYGFFRMVVGNFAWNQVFSFSQLFFFFGKKISSEIHVFRSDQFSLLMYRCLLPSSVTVKMEYERNIILCCIRSVTVNIRSMSLNTYNKNVDIWHYCIISQITLHGFWKRSALTNMKKDAYDK
jgi:hypothetical protein